MHILSDISCVGILCLFRLLSSSLYVLYALSCAHLFIFFLYFRIKEEPKPQPAQ